MTPEYYLSQQGPNAHPVEVEAFGRVWLLWPLSTLGIARELERWVVRFVRRNVELLRPADESDLVAAQLYQRDEAACQRAIRLGTYGAFAPDWNLVVNGTDAGFAEALYQCVRFKCPEWTREHVAALMADSAAYEWIHKFWMEFNYPKKVEAPKGREPTSLSRSAGTESSSPQ